MDTKALRYFQAVAEFGSYSRAAEFLRLSQPALSRQIAQLEQELQTPLFRRTGHGVALTEAGRRLRAHTQSILRQITQARDEIRASAKGPAGTIALAIPPAAGSYLIPRLAEQFATVCPNATLKIVGGYSAYIHEWLVRGQVDLACLHDPPPQRGFESIHLVEEPVYLVGRTGSFGKAPRAIRATDLAGFPLIVPSRSNSTRRQLDNWMAERGVTLDIRLEVDDPLMIRALLRAGHGFSLLSQGSIETELRHNEVEAVALRPAASWKLALVLPAQRPRPIIVTALVETITQTVHELTAAGIWPGRGLVANPMKLGETRAHS